MTLNDLLARPDITAVEVRALLEALPAVEQVRQATNLDRARLATLWRLFEADDRVTADELVEPAFPPLAPVTFEGQNNLPILRRFRKVLYRTSDGAIAGYNDSPARWFAGPGYFTVQPDGASVRLDYVVVPTEKPPSFPRLRSNAKGPAALVYGEMTDKLRRVSGTVLVGRAYRRGSATDNYFVVARSDP